jgi:hypothetical protein
MKKILIATALVCSILTGCSNNAENENTHKHDDGSTHEDHAEGTPSSKQEEFNVDSGKIDTAAQAAPHAHDESKPHSH